MAKPNLLNVILNTINEVQKKNQASPREETADSTIFDMLRSGLNNIDQKSKQQRAEKGKSPVSILDMIRGQIENAKTQNAQDPNQRTAPPQIFDRIIKKVDQRPQRSANASIRRIIEEYNLDVSRLHPDLVRQIQQKYNADRKKMDDGYARAIHDLIRRQG